MELRTRNAWAAALLAVLMVALAPGLAVADELDPGELKAIMERGTTVEESGPAEFKAPMESFSVSGIGSMDGLDPGEFKAIAEAPARIAAMDPGELKALTEARTWPDQAAAGSDSTGSSGINWEAAGVATLVLLFTLGAGVLFFRSRHDRIARA